MPPPSPRTAGHRLVRSTVRPASSRWIRSHPHCEWTVTIDPSHDPVADHPLLSRVEQSALAGLEIRRPSADPDDDGLALYDGPVLAEPHLELFSRDALVVICKEVAVQVHLLVRSLGLSVADAVGPDKATEILEAEMVGSWLDHERAIGPPARRVRPRRAASMRSRPSCHCTRCSNRPSISPSHWSARPMPCTSASSTVPPAPTTTERAGARCCDRVVTRDWLPPYRPSTAGPGWSRSRDPRCRRGQVTLDPEATPVAVPDWAAIGQLSGSSKFSFEQRVSITKRPSRPPDTGFALRATSRESPLVP